MALENMTFLSSNSLEALRVICYLEGCHGQHLVTQAECQPFRCSVLELPKVAENWSWWAEWGFGEAVPAANSIRSLEF